MALTCSLCRNDIIEGQVYFHATLDARDAAELLDERTVRVPVWEQIASGRVLLRFCSPCAEEIDVFEEMTAAKA
jgi:hypothetical protein